MSRMFNKLLRVFKSDEWLAFTERALTIAALRDPDHAKNAVELLQKAPRSGRVKDGRLHRLALGLAATLGTPALAQTNTGSPIDSGETTEAAGAKTPERWAIHGQATFVDQGTLAFRSPYRGANSLNPALWGRPGKIEITSFDSRGRMGSFSDALQLAQTTGQPADITAVRHYQGRPGISFNLEQQVSNDLGIFAHGGVADGTIESYEFSDIDRSVATGLSLRGERWGRPNDTFGAAVVVNGISKIHEQFLNAGGLGILVGDGKLPYPGPEAIFEAYYDVAAYGPAHVSLDYQFVNNPGYNRDRGPASILAARLHAQF